MDRQRSALLFAFLLLGVGMAVATTYPPVQDLAYACQQNGMACNTTTDVTSGICRTLVFTTAGGPLQAQVCHKESDRYELYRQTAPTGDYEACVGNGCIDEMKGFASFTMPAVTPTNTTYTYLDPSTFSESCTFDGIPCAKLSDTTAGTCRTVLYNVDNDTDEEIATLLCHKGDSRYEFYRVFAPPGDLYVTMGPAFVDGIKGYDSFIVSTPVPPPLPPPPVPPPVNETCISATSVEDLDATCDGNITSDVMMGACREVRCGTSGGNLTVLACDKPDFGMKTYFEMYRQSFSGDPLEICLGETCLDGDLRGYQKSEPYCIG